jgi:hypothetical protein
MSNEEIVTQLTQRMTQIEASPIYAINIQSILSAIVKRMEEEALILSAEDLHLALEEVKEAICHNLDERDYIRHGA